MLCGILTSGAILLMSNSSVAVRFEYSSQRKIRERNKLHYRFAHWPIWIAVFYLAPGPFTFDLFAHGVHPYMAAWLGTVILGTGIAGLYGQLPGVEPKPYIIRFTEDRPNPVYRRICYTLAWSELVTYAVLNISGLAGAIITGHWRLQQIYSHFYFPLAATFWMLGALGLLPRVKRSTVGEGHERRYFYGAVWACVVAQPILGLLWLWLPRGRRFDIFRLGGFVGVLAFMAALAIRGYLPRTRPILPGEIAVSD